MRRLLFWATVISGATAAYLMYRRGASVDSIISETVSHPIKTLASELSHNAT
jgi:hypothetical protein